MATSGTLPSADRIEGLFNDLSTQRSLVDTCLSAWRAASDRLASEGASLDARAQSLDDELVSLESSTAETLSSLADSEASLAGIHSAATALVEERREAAVAELDSETPPPAVDIPEILRRLCRWMDSPGLWRFMVSHRKDLVVLRKEIAEAVFGAVDPERLVLDAVLDFLGLQDLNVTAGQGQFWACGMLLRALLDGAEEGRKTLPGVAKSLADKAWEAAVSWKEKAEGRDNGDGMGGSEAQMFLQFIVAFGVQSRLEEEFLRKFIMQFASKKDMCKLVSQIGFREEVMEDMINELVNSGKQLEAVYFINEAGMTDRFSSVTLLKSCMEISKKKADEILLNGKKSAAAMDESNSHEMNALRSIVKCAQVLKLENDFPLESLKKRISVLEKAKAERKKSAYLKAAQKKRPNANGSTSDFRPFKASRGPDLPYPSHQMALARQPFGSASLGGYENPHIAPYGASYNQRLGGTAYPQHYYGTTEDITAPRGTGQYGAGSASYSGYDYAAPFQTPYASQASHTWHLKK